MSDAVYRIGVVAAALAAAALIGRLTFCHEVDLPGLPAEPEATREVVAKAVATVSSTERNPAAYARQLASDSRALHIEPPVTPDDLSGVMPYRADTQRRALDPGRKHATAHVLGLDLSLSVADVAGTPRRQMILTIENTTRDPLAYRVMTRASRGATACFDKSDITHNAIALAPGEKARRSECTYRKGLTLFIDRVETIEVPRLSYYYVSALPAAALALERADRLAARGHLPAGARSPCRVFLSAELTGALSSGAATWRDLVDFYARHPCGVYSFSIDYKAFDKPGERPLPAVAPGF